MELGNNSRVFRHHGDAVSRDKTPAHSGMCDQRACFPNLCVCNTRAGKRSMLPHRCCCWLVKLVGDQQSSRQDAAAGRRLFLKRIKHTGGVACRSRRSWRAGAGEREVHRWRVARGGRVPLPATDESLSCFTQCPAGASGSSSSFNQTQ